MTTSESNSSPLPLLGTKLRPPRRRRTNVSRRRLTDLSRSGDAAALTLVSAPAGFGKTTLVSGWFADGRVAWLSLDPSDNDPIRFWTYVTAAIEKVAPDLGPDSRSLLAEPRVSFDAFVTTLINDVEAAGTEFAVVLDDYHVIEAVEIHDSMAFLLDHLPDQMRVVITTRADPPLPLASMRAAGTLREVRAADLRFTAEETATYLNDAMGLSLPSDDIGVLESRTEGWIAALQLAALSLQGRANPDAFIAEFAGEDRFVLDYLTDEVLERQSPETRQFLIDTSILGQLNGPLCEAVTGVPNGRAVLDELDRSNLFIVTLDDRRGRYRYHHLFGDMLRARLLGEHPERVPGLHRRASEWFEANDAPQEAIVHALAGGDLARAADLIERTAPSMTRARQETLLRSWLESIPDDIYSDRPVLTIMLVGSRMSTGDPTGIEPLLERVERWLGTDDTPMVIDREEYARLPATIAMYRAGLALLDSDLDSTVRHANQVLGLVDADDLLRRGAAAGLLGLAHWHRGDLQLAHDWYSESISCFEDGGYLSDVMGCSLALADIQITQGRLHDARRTFDAALRHSAGRAAIRGTADMHAGLSLLATERNDLAAAAEHLRIVAELGEHMGLPQHPYRWRVAAAWLRRATGDLEGAVRLLDEAAPLYNTDFSPPVRPVTALRAWVQADLGDIDSASRWIDDSGLRADDDLAYVREFEHLTLARGMLARGSSVELEQATGLLGRLLSAADDGQRSGSAIAILVLLARVHQTAGRTVEARAAAKDALHRAGDAGFVRIFLDAGAPMTGLLGSLTGPGAERAQRVLSSEPAAGAQPLRNVSGPDELSDRELDVLRLLRSDLSGPEIARQLHVSLNTLRTHTKHIYTKLSATNRREAVSRATELDL